MGESVCLLRSFSQPADFSSHETNKVVPHRVLTESVSFGKFASETLSWEKWSAFTQNRYLEEIERFTKPGSVAQKKAFFEAHFKNRAAGRATQTKIKEANVATSDEIVCEVRKDNLVDLEVPVVVKNGMDIDEVRHREVSNNEGDSVVPSVSVIDETTDVRSGEVKVTTSVENLNLVSVPEDKALDEENSTSSSVDRPPSSCGSKACSNSSKLEPSVIGLDHSLKNSRKESSSSTKRSIGVLKNGSRLPPVPFHMSISCPPCGNTDKTIAGVPQNRAKVAGKADKKKRSGPKLVHMSLNFASTAHQTTKTAPKKLSRNSTTEKKIASNARNSVLRNGNEPTGASISRKRPFPRTAKESPEAAICSTSAPVTLPGLPPPYNQLSANKRKNMTVGSSVSCRMPNNVPRQPSVCRENLSTHSRTKAKSVTVSSPFVFRSDERAERRKEFFKKVEEKNKKENTGKENLSCGFKTNQNTHLASEELKNPQVGGFQVPLMSLKSPRFRRNQNPRTQNIKKPLQTPHKASSMKILNTRKAVMEKLESPKIHPSIKTQKIKAQENSSPNIVQN